MTWAIFAGGLNRALHSPDVTNTLAAALTRTLKTAHLSTMVAALLLVLVGWTGTATAQTLNPRTAEFAPSSDHTATGADGSAIVQSYQIEFYLNGASAPFSTASLGKPSPQSDGMIRSDLSAIFLGWPVPGTVYTSTVAAVGPGGTGRSSQSNTFSFSAPCAFTVTPVSLNPVAAAGSSSVSVATTAGCTWAASTTTSWISVASGASGTGNGTVGLNFTANTSTTSRTGSVTVGGKTVNVTQQGVACTYTVSPGSLSPVAGASTASLSVATAAGCSWAAAESVSWLSITSGTSGTGNGTVALSITANTTISARSATVTVGGQAINVTQAGTACTYGVSPTSISPAAGGGPSTATVTAQTGCAWTATETTSWITLSSGASGSGNGSVGINVDANTTTSARTGTITVAGKTINVTQPGINCTYSVSPTSLNQSAAAGSSTVSVTAAAGCTWTAAESSSWITLSSGASGSGNGTVSLSLTANTATASRAATVTVAGQSVSITQQGTGCTYSITPTSASSPAAGGTQSVTVTATSGCAWSASTSNSWITINSGSTGSGNGAVSFAVAVNSATVARTGSLVIAGNTLTLTQAAGNGAPSAPTGFRITQ